MNLPRLGNETARRHFLGAHLLAEPPAGPARGEDLRTLVQGLGFVQVDSIATVARAHDMIVFARRPAYRPGGLEVPVARHRTMFEHWTHDASILPIEAYPYWRLRFERNREKLAAKWNSWQRHGFEEKFDEVLNRIARNGPVCSADVGDDEQRSNGGWWDWHPSKTALEYLWRTGSLMVCHRKGFRKYYDLAERVAPQAVAAPRPDDPEIIDWACRQALDRLGLATSGELAAFYDLVSPADAKVWAANALERGEVIEIEVEQADGRWRKVMCWPDLPDRAVPRPPPRVRVLSPFDPALRDRKRALRLFGFDYRIEIFVPEPKRTYGYYVFPVLESDRVIGRIDMKCDRGSDRLAVRAFWREPGVRMGQGRVGRLCDELDRIARFAGVAEIEFAGDWLRDPVR